MQVAAIRKSANTWNMKTLHTYYYSQQKQHTATIMTDSLLVKTKVL